MVTGFCPAECGRPRGPEKQAYLCVTCWRECPAYLRRAVSRTWAAYLRVLDDDGASQQLRDTRLQGFIDAQLLAVAEVICARELGEKVP